MRFKISKIKFFVVLLFVGVASKGVLAQQNPGALDPTFNNGGIISRFIGSPSIARAVAVQPDGKIVQSGWFGSRFGLIRYNGNGSLDRSFGFGGVATTNINNWAFVESMTIQNDGRIVAAGSSFEGRQVAAVARYNTNGTLDRSFGGDGTVTTASPLTAPSPNVFNFFASDMAVQQDGKIVVVGESYYCAIEDDFCDFGPIEDYFTAVRYNVDGTVDPTFGNSGFIVETNSYYAPKIALGENGRIIVTGGTSILQYKSDGSLDTTFGVGGVASAPNTASDIAIQSDGKIVFSFYAYAGGSQAFGVARYRDSGTPDTTFGSNGVVVTAEGGSFGSVSKSLALQADGRIVVAGTGFGPNVDWRYVVRRYNPNGTLDHSYGIDGITRVQVGGQHNEGFAVAIDANGRAVVAGCAFSDSGWGLIRLDGGGFLSP